MKTIARTSVALLVSTAAASAATLTVTSLADDGSAGTLRSLVASAASGDAIVFDDTLAGGTIAVAADSGPIEVTTTLSIVGPAEAPITIDGQGGAGGACAYDGGSRTTNLIYANSADATITLRNLVFTGSKTDQPSSTPEVGPAVSILGAAVIDNCCWTNNGMAQSGSFSDTTSDGGTCLRVLGDLTLLNSRFVDNGCNGCNYSMGGLLSLAGASVAISNCVFSGAYGWGGSTQGGNVRGGGIMGLGADVADFEMTDCLLEKATASAGPAGILLSKSCAGSYRFRNCAFRNLWGTSANWRHGNAFAYDGNSAITLLFENTEFSNVRINAWGGAVRVAAGGAYAVFANCTFVNCHGSGWGGATDTRCTTCFVNCTAAGNVNGASENNGCGAFFAIDKPHYLLNTVCAWNYNKNGALLDDCSRYSSTLGVYNSYNHPGGNAANATDNAMDYDTTTVFFSEAFATISAITAWGGSQALANEISTPVLTVDETAEAKNPALRRVVEIVAGKDEGVLDRAGWPIKHSADWSSIAYSKDGGETWTALCGSVDDATAFLAADSRGLSYPGTSKGLPIPPIGSAAVKQPTGLSLIIF